MTKVAAPDTAGRIQRLRAVMDEHAIEGMLITDPVNVGYMTGFSGSSGTALITRGGAYLVTDPRYTLQAQEECPALKVMISAGSRNTVPTLAKLLSGRAHVSRLAFESSISYWDWISYRDALRTNRIEITAATGLIEGLRAVKDDHEVALIRSAIQIAEAAFMSAIRWIRPGATEIEVAAVIENSMRVAGATRPSFDTIAASGTMGARPHYLAGQRTMAGGEFLTLDWGAQAAGYCSDITRTVAVGGEDRFTLEHKNRYSAVLESQQTAIAAMKPGVKGSDIDRVARETLAQYDLDKYFTHSVGHALGRVVHDGSVMSQSLGDWTLEPGMVLTVEPGIYIEGWGGIRIEEDVLITPTGHEVLTTLPNMLQYFG